MDYLRSIIQIPFTNPTLIFFIVLSIILLAPIALNKIRVPHIIGLLLAGVIIGPNGTGILLRDTSFELFGKVGLLYLMFLAGLEMDMNDFVKNRTKGIVFGLYTFIIPMVLGTLGGYYILHFSLITSILLASMYASHTLVAYPIVSRYGVTKNRSVTITIAGTIITVLLALLILAVITGMYKGELNAMFWTKFVLANIIFCFILFYAFPRITKWFFRKYDDKVSQYIFVLALVFSASFGAELAGLEGIIGAFLAGVILNRFIPAVSPLMNRIEFVGNALFIPYFLIGVGMLVDLKVLFSGTEALFVALNMSVIATISKWLAAWLTQKSFKMTKVERRMIFGLSNGQAAATLAAVLIGYNIIIGTDANGEVIRLLNENILNGTIIMILVTCTISSIVTEKAAVDLATQENNITPHKASINEERILIPVANPSTIDNLVNLALMLKNSKKKSPLYALNIEVDIDGSKEMKNNNALLNKVANIASAADTKVNMLLRADINIANGIIHTIKENSITEVVVGFHYKADIADTFFGPTTQMILRGTNRMLTILKADIPVNTINKMVIAVPAKAEYETGFTRWVDRISNICVQSGCRAVFYSNENTLNCIKNVINIQKHNYRFECEILKDWDDFKALKDVVNKDDFFAVICARHTSISYHHSFDRLPNILSAGFSHTNLLVIYPEQFGDESQTNFFSDPQALDVQKQLPSLRYYHSLLKDFLTGRKK
ncbi:MAG: cation:proton antiporter [Bacteroidales bacterium]|nr:cation:proton antiporter [Bacteroidales bacterium]